MNKIKTLIILIAATTIYTSCTKDDSKTDPDPDKLDSVTIMGFKDSTLLIKSITMKGINSSGNYIDSNIIYLYYDTINKKIIFNKNNPASPTPGPSSLVNSYNNEGLLIRVDGSDPEGNYTNYYTYDAQNVLSSATMIDMEGEKETLYFTKKMLSGGGYSISAKDSSEFLEYDQIEAYSFNFNGNNQLIMMNASVYPSLDDGITDSIYYDTFGNVSKVTETTFVPGDPPSTITLYEFSSRDTKGDQYYNFNKIVMNGIASLPNLFGNFGVGSEIAGINNIYLYQFTKYPASSAKFHKWDYSGNDTYVTFKPEAEYDSKNRLVKFKLYFGDDPYHSDEYQLTYYK